MPLFQTLQFCIKLLEKRSPFGLVSTFSFQPAMEMEALGIDLVEDDVLHNLVIRESHLIRGTTPWKRPKEKDLLFMQILIESITLVDDVVLDCTATTSMWSFLHLFHILLTLFFSPLLICFWELTHKFIICRVFYSQLSKIWSSCCCYRRGCNNFQRHPSVPNWRPYQ